MAKQINSSLIEIVKVNELPDLALAVQNYFAHCGINGVLGKSDINSLAIFLAPYITAIGGSGFLATTGTALPAASAGKYTIVGVGTFTQATGGSITTTQPINILASNASTWSLAVAIPIDLSSYAPKSNKVLIPVNATYLDSIYDSTGVLIVRTGFNARLFPYESGRFYHTSVFGTSPTNYISFFTSGKAFISSVALSINTTYTENDITALIPLGTAYIGVNGNSTNTLLAYNSVFDFANRTDLSAYTKTSDFLPVKLNVDQLSVKLNLYKDTYGDLSLVYATERNASVGSFINNETLSRAGKINNFTIIVGAVTTASLAVEIWRGGIVVASASRNITANSTNNLTDLNLDVLQGDYVGIRGSSFKYNSGGTPGRSFYTTSPSGALTNNSYIAYSYIVESILTTESIKAQSDILKAIVQDGFTTKYGDTSLTYATTSVATNDFANNLPISSPGVCNVFRIKVTVASVGNVLTLRQYRIVDGKMTLVSSFVTTAVANSINVFNPNFNVKVGDFIGYKSSGNITVTFASGTMPGKSFYTINVTTGAFLATANSQLAIDFEIVSQSLKSIVEAGVIAKSNFTPPVPPHVYTVCQDVVTLGNPPIRDYKASIVLDHFLNGLTSEPKIKFKNLGLRYDFYSPKKIVGSTYSYNEGVSILRTSKNITITGENINDFVLTTEHISTRATNAADKLFKPLFIGDSIIRAQGAVWPGDIQTYSIDVLTKQLLEMNKIDNGGVGYDCINIGTLLRNLSFSYAGSTRNVRSCYEGRNGWTTQMYLANTAGNPFWDSVNSKFSIKSYLAKWRTMTDAGVRLAINDPTIGTSITSANLPNIDVCRPNIIFLETGKNDADNPATYVTAITGWANQIKAEYAAEGWGDINIVICMPDSAGTYFPSFHDWIEESGLIWNSILETGGSRHDKDYRFTVAILEYFKTINSDTAKLHYLPWYFTAPSAESLQLRTANEFQAPGNPFPDKFIGNVPYGDQPAVHGGPNMHAAGAYQAYSLMTFLASTI